MDQLNTWFMEAAGFSGLALSDFIRSFTLFVAVIWAAFIAQAMIGDLHTIDEPMHIFPKLVVLAVLIVALWIVMY